MAQQYDFDTEYERAMTQPSTGPFRALYYISKPGDQRDFATATPPAPEWAQSLKEQGYKILRITFPLPRGWDSADATISTMRNEQVEDVTDELTNEQRG